MPISSAARRLSLALTAMLVLALPAKAAGALDPYLPKSGKILGHVMKLTVAPEDQAIDRQFRSAVQNNMDWFKNYVRSQKPGVPLPYDRRMGITEAQYQKLQHMRADFEPGEAIEIDVTKAADGRVTFASHDAKATELSKVSFPPDGKDAETPYGKLSIFNEIHQKNDKAPIGLWNGVEWARVSDEGSDSPSAKIAFGKRDPSGQGVMYYQVSAYKDHTEQSLVVFYKLD